MWQAREGKGEEGSRMLSLTKTWSPDPRIAATSREWMVVGSTFQLRLVDDSRWPWLLLMPMVPGAVEIDDLGVEMAGIAMRRAAQAGRALRAATGRTKTNIATIGNVVPQLHIHVVARAEGDPAWPAPVWGHGEAVPYTADEAADLRARFDAAWKEQTSWFDRLP